MIHNHHDHDHHDGHDQGDGCSHHGGLDPHIWLSPPLVKKQAHTIATSLQELDPTNRAMYAANHDRFIGAINQLDAELGTIFAEKQGMEFMVFHPVRGYFADAYDLRQVPIKIEGKEPKPDQLQRLINHTHSRNITTVFVQPQFSTSANVISTEIGDQVVFADPPTENWMENLRQIAEIFKAALW